MTTTDKIIALAADHGLDAIDNGDSAIILIPYINVRNDETGTAEIVCSTVLEAYEAIGY